MGKIFFRIFHYPSSFRTITHARHIAAPYNIYSGFSYILRTIVKKTHISGTSAQMSQPMYKISLFLKVYNRKMVL